MDTEEFLNRPLPKKNTSKSDFKNITTEHVSGVNNKSNRIKQGQIDLFVSSIADVSTKSDQFSMQLPFFSLSKRIEKGTRIFKISEKKDGIERIKTLEIQSTDAGFPTIWDKDILLFCTSQIIDAINKGQRVVKTLRVNAYNLLISTDRGTGGNNYTLLVDAIKRLEGARFYVTETKPSSDIKRQFESLAGFIEKATVIEYDDKDRATTIDITLTESFFLALLEKRVLTLNSKYFKITGGIERRLYEIARKFCGKSKKWSISLEKLQERVGSRGTKRKFREKIREIEINGLLDEYNVRYDEKKDIVSFSTT